jgi:hypothetical protein
MPSVEVTAQAHDIFVSPAIAHHADGFYQQQHREGLPYLVVEAGFADLVDIDGIGIAQKSRASPA